MRNYCCRPPKTMFVRRKPSSRDCSPYPTIPASTWRSANRRPFPPGSDDIIQEALQKRPDLIERDSYGVVSAIRPRRTGLLSRPTIGLLGTAGYVPAGETPVPGTYGAIGLNVHFLVFNGGLFKRPPVRGRFKIGRGREKGCATFNFRSNATSESPGSVRTIIRAAGTSQQFLNQAKLALDLSQAR